MLPGFLHSLSDTLQHDLLQQARPLNWTRGQSIVHAADAADTLFVIQQGHARLYQLSSREITINVLGGGELLGCRTLLGGGVYGIHADTLDDLSALAFEGAALRSYMRQSSELGAAMSAQLCRQSRNLQDRLAQLVFLEVSQRLALALLALLEQSESQESSAPLPLKGRISHQDLAYTVGSTRETITKVLGEFRKRGLLDLGYRRIVVTDRAGLEEAAKTPMAM